MSRSLILFAVSVSVACAGAFGQSFECYPLGPLPTDPSGSCEGIASNNLGFTTGVTATVSCGFPTLGSKYVRLSCNGPVPLVPNGGPFPFPASSYPVTEARVPIPSGSTSVSFDWEYFNAESFGSSFNDGMSIAIVGTGGNLIQQLAYADNQMPLASCTSSGTEVSPAGPQSVLVALPLLAGCEYMSMICWNEGDNAVSGSAYVDNIQFNATAPACLVPCFVLSPPPTLAFSSPSGSGCIQVNLSNMPGGGLYFLGVTLQPGGFPNGWFFGIDIGFAELQTEINTGFPFLGAVSGSSCSGLGAVQIGQFCGVPSGLTVYAVGLGAPFGSSFPSAVTNAAAYTVP